MEGLAWKRDTVFFQNGEEGMMRKGMGKFVGVGKEVKKFLSIFFVSVSYVRRKGDGY